MKWKTIRDGYRIPGVPLLFPRKYDAAWYGIHNGIPAGEMERARALVKGREPETVTYGEGRAKKIVKYYEVEEWI